MKKRIFTLLFAGGILLAGKAFSRPLAYPAPHPGGDTARNLQVHRNELVPAYVLKEVEIRGRTLTEEEKMAYLRLVYNVRRTYPYAVLAKERMEQYNALRREAANKKEMRRYLREEESKIKADFTEDLKNMTRSQGAILIKLLSRQTDTTAYFLLKEFRGGARASAYQTMARLWGYNLKETYQPEGRDRDIETIVQMIEQGKIGTIAPKVTPAMDRKRNRTRGKAASNAQKQ